MIKKKRTKYFGTLCFFFLPLFGVFGENEKTWSVQMDCQTPKHGPPGAQGEAGAQGPQGGPGPVGPPGSGFEASGSFYTTETNLTIQPDFNVPFDATAEAVNITNTAGILTINLPGDYLVTYGVAPISLSTGISGTFCLNLNNGTQLTGSFSNFTLAQQPAGPDERYFEALSIIIPITSANSTLAVQNSGTNNVVLGTSDGTSTSAYITVLRLGDVAP